MRVVRGIREDLAAELDEFAGGRDHFGDPVLAATAREAAAELRNGADQVTVGHSRYEVSAASGARTS